MSSPANTPQPGGVGRGFSAHAALIQRGHKDVPTLLGFFAGKLTREHPNYPTMDEKATLLGCPACGHVFMTTKHYHKGEK